MPDAFDGAREPMRALRDLIVICEATFTVDTGQIAALARAQAALTALRAIHGDTRPAEAIAEGHMREPDLTLMQMLAGALLITARQLPSGEHATVVFTGDWIHLGSPKISDILDVANEALGIAGAPLQVTVQ